MINVYNDVEQSRRQLQIRVFFIIIVVGMVRFVGSFRVRQTTVSTPASPGPTVHYSNLYRVHVCNGAP